MYQEKEVTRCIQTTLKALLDYSQDETFLDAEEAASFGAGTDPDPTTCLNISFVRGSSSRTPTKLCEGCCKLSTSEDVFEEAPQRRLSFTSSEISDADFFDSHAGKEMIKKDQEIMEKELELLLQNVDSNCTRCNSCIPSTSKKNSELQLPADNALKSKLNTSTCEYLSLRTECSFSGSSIHHKAFTGRETSTPIRNRSEEPSFDTDILKGMSETCSQLNIASQTAPTGISGAFALFPVFLYSITQNEEKSEKCHYYIGSPFYESVQKLNADKEKRLNSWLSESAESKTDITIKITTGDFKISSTETFLSSHNKDNEMEECTVEPQGKRVLIKNNSPENMKFKTKFDGNIINVSPLSGTINAKDQIGLRILVSRSIKIEKKAIETTIKVIAGKKLKLINVNIIKEPKSKFVRKRSFIIHNSLSKTFD